MKKITHVVVLTVCILVGLKVQAAIPPNILLIYVDDLGYGDLGSFGHPIIKTPHLDQLAAEGLTLTNYYAPSALCSPSRAALLTGRLPYRSGIKSWIPEGSGIYLRREEITLAEILKSKGYSTALVGKWHLNSSLGDPDEPQPQDQGFDYAYGHNAFQIPTNKNPTNIYRNGKAVGVQKGYTADLYADEAIAWLKQRASSKPFFLFLSMAEPHTTIENPSEYNQMYGDYTRGEVVPIPSGTKSIPKDKLTPRGPGEYFANITYLDTQLGRVLDELERLNIDSNTVVVFASDNGPVTSAWINWWEVNSYGSTGGLRGRKHNLYEGGIKVPAMIRYPGVIKPASTSNEVVIGMDLFTTLVEIGGGEIPSDRPIDGVSLAPIFGDKKLPTRSLFWSLDADSDLEYVIRDRGWKLMIDKNRRPKELYNLDEDPLEFFNLIDDEANQTARLHQLYRQQMTSIEQDPLRPE